MKKSELIKELQADVDKYGDQELLEYKVICAREGKSGGKYSPTRLTKEGRRSEILKRIERRQRRADLVGWNVYSNPNT